MQKGDFLYIFKGLNCSYKLLKEPAPCVAADVSGYLGADVVL